MSKLIAGILSGALIVMVLLFGVTPGGRAAVNNWMFSVQKADDATAYSARKKVEDTCRAMVSSYEADKLTYEQYRDSDSAEKQNWGEQAKMRANKTAPSYNNYILENSFVWANSIPGDIAHSLDVLE